MKEVIKNVTLVVVTAAAVLFVKELLEFFKDPFDFDGLENVWFHDDA